MTRLQDYLEDGANYQAKAVLCMLQGKGEAIIEESWNKDLNEYEAKIDVARWENCREQGYIVSLRDKKNVKLNIAFFEHRNSDSICAVKWVQNSINTLTIDSASFGDIYKDKWDVSYKVGFGQVSKMSDWIACELKEFYIETMNL